MATPDEARRTAAMLINQTKSCEKALAHAVKMREDCHPSASIVFWKKVERAIIDAAPNGEYLGLDSDGLARFKVSGAVLDPMKKAVADAIRHWSV